MIEAVDEVRLKGESGIGPCTISAAVIERLSMLHTSALSLERIL